MVFKGGTESQLPVYLLATFFSALGITLFVLPRLAHIAQKIGLLDQPDVRKVHSVPKPLVGGLGMIVGLAFSGFLFIPLTNLRGFYAGIILLVIAGFFDDFRELHHRWRFVAQIVAAVLMIYFSRTVLQSFGNLLGFGPIDFGSFDIAVTIFCTVGVINAINMIDGVDGLAGGVSLIAFLAFSVLAYINEQPALMLLSIALAGVVAGFLRYNWFPARLFMGDAGSMFIGFSLAFLSIAIAEKENGVVRPVAPLLVLAVPIVDTLAVMTKRVLKGLSPFVADTNHVHHLLLSLGYCKKMVNKIIFFTAFGFSLMAVSSTVLKIPDYLLFYPFLVFGALHFTFSLRAKKIIRKASILATQEQSSTMTSIVKRLLSRIDSITGLLNKNGIIENLECEFKMAGKQNSDLALILCEIEDLQRINEVHGHAVGERVLTRTAETIRETARDTDIVGRYAGSTFMLILPETPPSGAETLVQKLRSAVSRTVVTVNGSEMKKVSLHFGIAGAEEDMKYKDILIKRAEEALQRNATRRVHSE